jgi:hypothetical protein
MPYFTKPESKKFDPRERLPHHLYHKPIYAVPYEHFDGMYSDENGETDALYITIGLAQWPENDDVSVKVMRYDDKNGKWSRGSEELPLSRAVDLATFIALTVFGAENGYLDIPAGTLHNQDQPIHVVQEQRSEDELKTFEQGTKWHEHVLRERLNKLAEVLNELKKKGRL